MRQLSAHDAGFLYADTSHANSNVTLIQIYDQSTAPGGKVRFKSILAHIESRLSGLPIFRSKLQRVPLDRTCRIGSTTRTSTSNTTCATSHCPSRATGASSASRPRASTRARST